MLRKLFFTLLSGIAVLSASCGRQEEESGGRTLSISLGTRITSLDPALAADTASQSIAGALYDTPLQYSYRGRPYRLECSMLAEMPSVSDDMRIFRCRLRDDLYFQEVPCFPDRQSRKITAADLAFSILRLADARVRSTGYWLIRDRIKGIAGFRAKTAQAEKYDMAPYDAGCQGIRILDDLTFEIELDKPDPRFLYALALPYFSAVSRKAVEYYKDSFADHPAGSGPFAVTQWTKDFIIRMKRYTDYRKELLPSAENPADRTRKLPLLDEITCYLVKQPLAAWLMFLQGELDYCSLSGENFEAVVNDEMELSPALRKRGIRLISAPDLQTNYIGFNFSDPVLGSNVNLRRAISLAFDKDLRCRTSNGRLIPANGPVPPGADGFLKDYEGPYGRFNVELAKEYMKKAGYPGGMDPETGRNLELTFDQAGSSTLYRQIAEMLAADLKRIGIVLRPEFNNRSRFFQKLNQGQFQLFRLSWTGDYPDAENFLQLFYGPNSDSCNRIFFRDAEFDRMYEEVRPMPDSGERTAKYEKMSKLLTEKCPWIFESYTVSFMLTHRWVTNYVPHDFGFNAWKYFSVDPELRTKTKHSFTPISMGDLRK